MSSDCFIVVIEGDHLRKDVEALAARVIQVKDEKVVGTKNRYGVPEDCVRDVQKLLEGKSEVVS